MKAKGFIYILLLVAMGMVAMPSAAQSLKPEYKVKEYWNVTAPQKLLFPLYDTITISFIGDVMQHLPQVTTAKAVASKSKDSSALQTKSANVTITNQSTAIKAQSPKAALQSTTASSSAAPQYDYTNTFKYIEERIAEADYMVANMELTIGTPPYSGYPQFSSPPDIAIQAQKVGIDLFMMANNHIVDKGKKGLERTFSLYRQLGVQTVGVYENASAEEKDNPLIVNIKGVKFAFFNFTYDTNGIPVPAPYIVCQEDTAHIKKVVQRARAKGADFIIALPHWGLEYHLQQSKDQQKLAEYMLGLGVDAVVGGHPHVTQPVTVTAHGVSATYSLKYLKGTSASTSSSNSTSTTSGTSTSTRASTSTSTRPITAIFYSLGNYVSNMVRPKETQTGMFVTLRFVRNRLTLRTQMLTPEWFYTYCYRPGETLPDGTRSDDYIVMPLQGH